MPHFAAVDGMDRARSNPSLSNMCAICLRDRRRGDGLWIDCHLDSPKQTRVRGFHSVANLAER